MDAETLDSLKAAVAGIKEPAFQYDKMYVYECMEWGSPTSAPAAPGELQWLYLAKVLTLGPGRIYLCIHAGLTPSGAARTAAPCMLKRCMHPRVCCGICLYGALLSPEDDHHVVRSERMSAPAAAKGKLYAATSYEGHAEPVYTLAYDPVHNQLVSAGKDSCILLWDAHGKVAAR